MKIHRLAKAFALCVGLILVGVSLASIGMSMGKGSEMPGCVFVRDSKAACPMSMSQHLQTWQSTFSSIPAVRVASLITVLFNLGFVSWFLNRSLGLDLFSIEYRHRYREKVPETKLFDYLQLAFSRGILQPLVYA